jgi:hypothetical protein
LSDSTICNNCKKTPKKLAHKGLSLCNACYNKHLLKNNPDYHKRQIANAAKWRKNNKERELKNRKNYYNKIKNDPEQLREYKKRRYLSWVKTKFGLEKEELIKLQQKHNNKCALCFDSPSKNKKLHIDHCHQTGKVRGLLCFKCNWYLAMVERDHHILRRIEKYLEI